MLIIDYLLLWILHLLLEKLSYFFLTKCIEAWATEVILFFQLCQFLILCGERWKRYENKWMLSMAYYLCDTEHSSLNTVHVVDPF